MLQSYDPFGKPGGGAPHVCFLFAHLIYMYISLFSTNGTDTYFNDGNDNFALFKTILFRLFF